MKATATDPPLDTRFWLAALAAGITLLPVGYLLYGVLFAALFSQGALTIPGVMRSPPNVWWILAGQAGFGVLVALMVRWRGKLTLRGGAEAGALLGLLMAIGYDFAQFGTSHLWTLRATLVDPFLSAALVSCAGAVAGWILGGRNKR